MEADLEITLSVFFQIVLVILWLCVFGCVMRLFLLWVSLCNDSKGRRGLLSIVFPLFLFDSSVLSDTGKLDRVAFFRTLYIFVFLVVVSIAMLLALS